MNTQDNLQEADGLSEKIIKDQKKKKPLKDAVEQVVKKDPDVEVVSEANEPKKEGPIENKEVEPNEASIKESEDAYDNFDLEALIDAFGVARLSVKNSIHVAHTLLTGITFA